MNILDAIRALRAGNELRNAAAWKNRQNTVNALVGILGVAAAVAQAYGIDLRLSDDLAAGLAAGIWAAVNLYFTTATSAKVGVRPKRSDG